MINIQKLTEYLLYVLVFLLPIQTRWIIGSRGFDGFSEYTALSLYGTDIILAVLICLFILSLVIRPKIPNSKFQIPKIWFFIGLLILSSLVSTFFALDKTLAFFGLARFLLGVGLFWMITEAAYDKMKLTLSMLTGVFLQAALAVWQFLNQATFASKWLGIASHSTSGVAGESVIEMTSGRWLRAYGGLDHPNILGGLMAMAMLVMIIVVLKVVKDMYDKYSKEKDWHIFPIKKTIAWIVIYYTALIILSAGLFFSFSRTAWLALVTGLLIILAILVYKKVLVLQVQFFKTVIAIGLVFGALFFIYGSLVEARTSAEGRLENKSLSERALYFNDFKGVIKNDWLTGVGLDNFVLAVQKNDPSRPVYSYQPVHNVFLLIWAEAGLLGLIATIALVLYGFFAFLKMASDSTKFDIMNIALLAALGVIMMLDHWLWSLHFGLLFFWLILGCINAKEA